MFESFPSPVTVLRPPSAPAAVPGRPPGPRPPASPPTSPLLLSLFAGLTPPPPSSAPRGHSPGSLSSQSNPSPAAPLSFQLVSPPPLHHPLVQTRLQLKMENKSGLSTGYVKRIFNLTSDNMTLF